MRPDLRKSISLTPSLSSTPENVTRIVVNANSAPGVPAQLDDHSSRNLTGPPPPPLLTQNSAPSVLHRQRVVIKPDPSLLRFDSSESDNEEGHSQFPGSSRKNSRETPKSRPVVHRRPPKRVQFGTQDEDEPDDFERQQPRQLMSRYTIRIAGVLILLADRKCKKSK